jgi:type I restriction enzyme S subunit
MTGLVNYPQYDGYKDSGVEWLGMIPIHWEIEKGKWLFKKMERPISIDDEIVTCFRDGEVTLRKNRRTEGFTNALKEHGYQGIRKGDLVIHAMDAFAGAIGVSDSDGKSTPVYAACIPRKDNLVNPNYYAYYMRDLALSGFIISLAKGIRERSTDFRFNDFSLLTLPLPNYNEQGAIANFLDQKTTQIDEAIALKQKQIALLKERKQILIQNAVTQGLNPNAPMKDSGIDWIGQIPEKWSLRKVKFLAQVNKKTLSENTLPSLELRYVDIGSVSFENGIEKIETFKFKDSPSRARRLAKTGDTIVSTVRTYLKAVARVDKDSSNYVFSTGFAVIEPLELIDSKFLYLCTKSDAFTIQVELNSKGMSYPAINSTDLSNLYLVVPPIEEQIKLVEFTEDQLSRIQDGLNLQMLQIEKLKEYKATLINSAVTGKIKITPDMVA